MLVDWRDALPGAGEPNKRRTAVVVSSSRFFGSGLPFEIVVPLTAEEALAIAGASAAIDPKRSNCPSRALEKDWIPNHKRATRLYRALITSTRLRRPDRLLVAQPRIRGSSRSLTGARVTGLTMEPQRQMRLV